MIDQSKDSQLETLANTPLGKTSLTPEMMRKKIAQLANALSIDVNELHAWLENHLCVDPHALMSLLHLALTHKLDPMMGEVTVWVDADQQAHPNITIDGWMKIINCHPAFAGIAFEEAGTLEGQFPGVAPQYISCTIYRSDRQVPIQVREYLLEAVSEHSLWKTMPRRMLRHRALQQCARLAFGISTPEWVSHEYEGSNLPKTASSSSKLNNGASGEPSTLKKSTRTEQLKATLSVPIQAKQFAPPLR